MMPWFEEFEDRFIWERETLIKEGFSLLENVLEIEKKVVFIGTVNVQSKEYTLEIHYPVGFPFFPPECYCEDADFYNKKHILPNNGKLCLYEDWVDNSDLTGSRVLERAKEWIEKTLSDSFTISEEIDGPEPKQYHLFSSENQGLLIVSENMYQKDSSIKEGDFSVSLKQYENSLGNRFYKGLLSKIPDNQNIILNESELDFLKREGFECQGKFFEVQTAPPYFENQQELINWLEEQGHKDVLKKCEEASLHIRNKTIKKRIPPIGALLGIFYTDEIGIKGNFQKRFMLIGLKGYKIISNRPYHFPYVVFKTEEISQVKLFNRSPNLQPLSKKHILILGLGTIGSSMAVDLAKTGIGQLTLIDSDSVSIGNIIRQETNLMQVGFNKPQSIEDIIKVHNPYTRVNSYVEHWGINSNEAIIQERLKEVDLIVCATGHHHTEMYLNHLSYHYNIPVVYSYTGKGAWSGRAFRVVPGETGCYFCHRFFIDENVELHLTTPTSRTEIYDDGCATPAFTGSGIDTGIIANLATRLSIQTILVENKEAYEQTDNDHFVWLSQGNNGNLKIAQKKISIHPKCNRCNTNV